MTARLLGGKDVAARIYEELAATTRALSASGRPPGLGVILIGDDPGSRVYVNLKRKACAKVGIQSFEHKLSTDVSQEVVISCIESLNADRNVDGILVQLPLPPHLDPDPILEAVHPEKDVDGFHPINVGRLCRGKAEIIPCTPHGILKLLDSIDYDYRGKHAVVVGRSNIVGKPTAILLLHRHATVTICHRNTKDLAAEVSRADLIVSAAGAAGLIRGEWIKPGAAVIDVGSNRIEDRVVGDVDFEKAIERAAYITPVPGGVGPMTVAMLLHNIVHLAKKHQKI